MHDILASTVIIQYRTQEQMDNLTQTLTVQLEESKAGEAAKDEEITVLSKGMVKVKGQLQKAEAELELKRRGLEQSKSRERKLANEIHEVHIVRLWDACTCHCMYISVDTIIWK